jgi:hypothetical protein
VRTEQKWIEIETPSLLAVLNRRRGLALQEVRVRGDERPAMVTSLLHGHYEAIDLQFDWYSGYCVFESPARPKVSDLEWVQPQIYGEVNSADAVIEAQIATPLGPIFKRIRFLAKQARVEYDIILNWKEWGVGSLRIGHFLLNPDAFDPSSLAFATHNGGERMEVFPLGDRKVDHGKPVSLLVSATTGLGMTEGLIDIGDGRRGFRVEVDREMAPLIGLMQYERTGDSFFASLALSAMETDDTRKPDGPVRPRRFRYALNLGS